MLLASPHVDGFHVLHHICGPDKSWCGFSVDRLIILISIKFTHSYVYVCFVGRNKISHGKTTNVVQRLGPDQSSRHIDSERLVTKRLNLEISQVFSQIFKLKG